MALTISVTPINAIPTRCNGFFFLKTFTRLDAEYFFSLGFKPTKQFSASVAAVFCVQHENMPISKIKAWNDTCSMPLSLSVFPCHYQLSLVSGNFPFSLAVFKLLNILQELVMAFFFANCAHIAMATDKDNIIA